MSNRPTGPARPTNPPRPTDRPSAVRPAGGHTAPSVRPTAPGAARGPASARTAGANAGALDLRRSVLAFVRAFSRAMKAVGYYDSSHPILQQLHREVAARLKDVCQGQQPLMVACAGAKLIYSESAEPLTDESAKSLAAHLFGRSIVALKLHSSVGLPDLGTLFQAMAETPERIREAGGLKPILSQKASSGIEVFEVDFADVFAGKTTDVGANDPLVQRALGELLQFKEKKEKAGSALAISLDSVGTPESLGALLDELLDGAAPGVATPSVGPSTLPGGKGVPSGVAAARGKAKGGPGQPLQGVRGGGQFGTEALAGISAEELAELASQAFLGTCDKLVAQSASESQLADTARVLASALVRLNGEARFSLLRQLANPQKKGSPAAGKAVTSLSSQLKDDLIVSAISSVLAGQEGDPETLAAVTDLLRHLRPIESERRRLLDTLDESLRSEGHAIDGTLWQELQARALDSNGLGMLELPFRQKTKGLAEAAKAHLGQASASPEIQQVLLALDPRHRAIRSAKLLLELLPNNRELTSADASVAKDVVEALDLERQAPTDAHMRLLAFLLKRAEGLGSANAFVQTVKELLTGLKGVPRAIALLKSGHCRGSALLGDLLLQGMDGPLTIDGKRDLVAAFATMDDAMMRTVRSRVTDAKPFAVQQIVLAALRAGPNSGVEVARQGLRNRVLKSKEAALRALGTAKEQGAAALLAKAAGCDGDEESAKVLFLENIETPEGESNLRQAQRAAIEALGQTRSEHAVPALENLLMRRKLVGNAALDSLRTPVAQALAVNGTALARQVLAAGKASKHQSIREACAKW